MENTARIKRTGRERRTGQAVKKRSNDERINKYEQPENGITKRITN